MHHILYHEIQNDDFPGGPVVKTLSSNAWSKCLITGQVTKVPDAMACSQILKIIKYRMYFVLKDP